MMTMIKVSPRTAISLYVALVVHALLLLAVALRLPSQNPGGAGLGLGIPGTGLDEIERRLVTAPPPGAEVDARQLAVAPSSALARDRAREQRIEAEEKTPPRPKSPHAEAGTESGRARDAKVEGQRENSGRHAGGRMAGGGSDSYFARLRAHLAGFRRELRGGLPTATARVRVRVSPEGWISGLELVESSGLPELDSAALDLLRRAAPLPSPPDGRATRLIVPVSISGPG